jgi:hypothetical protein
MTPAKEFGEFNREGPAFRCAGALEDENDIDIDVDVDVDVDLEFGSEEFEREDGHA